MQTFLPYADFTRSAQSLDRLRLGKQRVETYQLLRGLLFPPGERAGWRNHPASRMWEGFELGLLRYQQATCTAWVERGYRDTCWEKSWALFSEEDQEVFWSRQEELPAWVGDGHFHQAHQSNLVRKDPAFYRPQFPDVPDDLPYIWPV